MQKMKNRSFPHWIFVILAIGGLLASGIFIGVLSVEGFTVARFAQSVAFGALGLVMFWGAIRSP